MCQFININFKYQIREKCARKLFYTQDKYNSLPHFNTFTSFIMHQYNDNHLLINKSDLHHQKVNFNLVR